MSWMVVSEVRWSEEYHLQILTNDKESSIDIGSKTLDLNSMKKDLHLG